MIVAKYIHISSNFILSMCLLILFGNLITKPITTLQHFATLHRTSLSYTSLYLPTLHYPLIWLNPIKVIEGKIMNVKTKKKKTYAPTG